MSFLKPEDTAGDRRHPVRQDPVRPNAEIPQHGRLGDEHGDRAGDEECGNEAKENVLPRVPLHEVECLGDGAAEPLVSHGHEQAAAEPDQEQNEGPRLPAPECQSPPRDRGQCVAR